MRQLFRVNHCIESRFKRVTEINAIYNFSSTDPLDRYLKSISELENCTVIHSIFKKKSIQEFDWPNIGSADHILLSNILWHGTLEYNEYAGYLRRMFDVDNRKRKKTSVIISTRKTGYYGIKEYMKNFIRCSDGHYPEEIYPFVKNLVFETLCTRFGLPNTLSTARNILAEISP